MNFEALYNLLYRRAYIAVPAACIVYYLLYFNYGIVLDDEGLLTWNAASILHGQWPIADFVSYQPAMYFLLAGFFRFFGETLVTERIFLILHILICVICLIWCGKRFLPARYALLPALLFAFAPGPWYKIFFIFHLLLVLVAALRCAERPDIRRAFWFGAAIGFAATSRAETVPLCLTLFAATLGLDCLARQWRDGREPLSATIGRLLKSIAAGAFGLALPIAILIAAYAGVGKLEAIATKLRIYSSGSYQFTVDLFGMAQIFNPLNLVRAPSLEDWFFALGLLGGFSLLAPNLFRFGLSDPVAALQARQKALVGGLALASMSYTFFFVWDSRMLSSFAVVYLAAIISLADLGSWLGQRGWPRGRVWAVPAGSFVLLAFVGIFCRTAIYSGSISAMFPPSVRVDHPFLKGAWIYNLHAPDIQRLMEIVKKTPKASIVPTSESTTMAYLSGLDNPTYFRLFTRELAPPGAEAAAIETFEREKIDYFVARSGQFIPGGARASDLNRYAPAVKTYLLSHYDLVSLGERYVLLVRRAS